MQYGDTLLVSENSWYGASIFAKHPHRCREERRPYFPAKTTECTPPLFEYDRWSINPLSLSAGYIISNRIQQMDIMYPDALREDLPLRRTQFLIVK